MRSLRSVPGTYNGVAAGEAGVTEGEPVVPPCLGCVSGVGGPGDKGRRSTSRRGTGGRRRPPLRATSPFREVLSAGFRLGPGSDVPGHQRRGSPRGKEVYKVPALLCRVARAPALFGANVQGKETFSCFNWIFVFMCRYLCFVL